MTLLEYIQEAATKETLSQALGYSSIFCWLFAQTPQVLANYRAKNCDGLALPFLMNWMAGDLLNCIGCFLTDQLEFQKYLALYFCFVDLGLLGQFYAYYKPSPPKGHGHHHHHDRTRRSLISSTSSSPRLLSASIQHATHAGTTSSSPSAHAPSTNRRRHARIPGSFEEMSAAAANVARAAEAVAASKRGGGTGSKGGSRSRSNKRKAPSGTPSMRGGARLEDSVTSLGAGSIRSNVSFQAGSPADGMPWEGLDSPNDSSNSSSKHNLAQPSPGASPVSTRSRMASNPGIHISNSTVSLESQSSSTTSPILVQRPPRQDGHDDHAPTASERGRTLTRPPPTFGVQPPTPENPAMLEDVMAQQNLRGAPQHLPLRRIGSRSLSVARGGGNGGRSTAGVVLMSLVGLVGLGGLGTTSTGLLSGRVMQPRELAVDGEPISIAGRILWSETSGLVPSSPSPPSASPDVLLSDIFTPSSNLADESFGSDYLPSSRKHRESDPDDRPRRNPHGVPAGPPVTWQRLIGRVSAWTCTVLYLTSRMPQIWKNFTRKSTEGLSLLLFVFAFLGNALYVSSILLNPLMDQPRPESTNFILESLPYLLGSGGTLLFDTSIVIQFFIYGSAPPLPEDAPQPWLNSGSKRTASHSHHASRSSRRGGGIGGEGDAEMDLESAPLLVDGQLRPRTRSTSAGGRSPIMYTAKSRSRSQNRATTTMMNGGGGEDALGLRGIVSGLGPTEGVDGLPYVDAFGPPSPLPRSRERTASSSGGGVGVGGLRESVIMEESGSGGSGSGEGSREGKLIDA